MRSLGHTCYFHDVHALFSYSVTRWPQSHLTTRKAVSSYLYALLDVFSLTSCWENEKLWILSQRVFRCVCRAYTASALAERFSSLGWQLPFCCTLLSSVLGASLFSASLPMLESGSLLCSFSYNEYLGKHLIFFSRAASCYI